MKRAAIFFAILAGCRAAEIWVPVNSGVRLVGATESAVYWVDDKCGLFAARADAVKRREPAYLMNLGACGPARVVTDPLGFLRLSPSSTVVRHKLSISPPEPPSLPPSEPPIFLMSSEQILGLQLTSAMAVDGQAYYVADCAESESCHITRYSKDGSTTRLQAQGLSTVVDLAVDDERIYWVDNGGFGWEEVDAPSGGIEWIDGVRQAPKIVKVRRKTKEGPPRLVSAAKSEPSEPTVLVQPFFSRHLWMTRRYLYWVDGQTLQRTAKTRGGVEVVAQQVSAVDARDDRVVWATENALWERVDDAAASKVASLSARATSLAVGPTHLYWIDGKNIMALQRR